MTPVRVGDKVENGQVLFSLDKSDLQTSYSSLSSEYTRTKELLEAQVQQAQTNYDNTAALLEVGAASQLELDTARVTLLSAQTSMASTLQQLEDNLQTLRDTMADADVKSTMDGMVSSLSVVVGATASPTSPAAVITERGSQVTVSVSEAVQPYLSIGDTAPGQWSPTASDEAIEATVRTISPSAGAMTQLFDVVLDLPEDTTLTAGMFATVLVETERRGKRHHRADRGHFERRRVPGRSTSWRTALPPSARLSPRGWWADGVTEVVEGPDRRRAACRRGAELPCRRRPPCASWRADAVKIVEFCIKHKVTTFLIFVIVVIFGLLGFSDLSLALLPNIDFPMAVVYATYPGAGPEEVEEACHKADRIGLRHRVGHGGADLNLLGKHEHGYGHLLRRHQHGHGRP